MVQVTADDIKVLAKDNSADPVLILANGQILVVPGAEATPDQIVYSKAELAEEYGVDLTEAEAGLAASNLTALIEE
jgi:hypothetical protein